MDAIRNLSLGLTAAAISIAAPGHAQTQVDDPQAVAEPVRRYNVELIIFTYDSSVSSGTEVFVPDKPALPEGPGLAGRDNTRYADGEAELSRDAVPEYGDTVDLQEKLGPGEEVLAELLETRSLNLRLLTADELTLKDAHDRLRRLDAYEPVLWAGWTQDVYAEDMTAAIRLRRLGNLPVNIDGEMKLYLGRFLHLVADVSVQAPGSGTARPSYRVRPAREFGRDYDYAPDRRVEDRAIYYRIDEDRIMKNGDIRYFDHPKFGILAKTTRAADAMPTSIEGSAPGVEQDANAGTSIEQR